MCLCVCPVNILVFYFSAIIRDIDLKCIYDTYGVVLNLLTKSTLLFEGTVISHKDRQTGDSADYI